MSNEQAKHIRLVPGDPEPFDHDGPGGGPAGHAAGDSEAPARAAFERGDHRRATDLLIELYGTDVYRYIRMMVGDDTLAEDVWQTTFIQAFRDFGRYAGRSSLRTWVYGIARHRCLDALKASRRHERRYVLDEVAPEAPDAAPTADQRLSDQQVQQALEQCLQALPPHVRIAVLLRFRDGFSFAEIAELAGERATTWRARISRGLPLLRRCIEKQGLL